MKVPQPLQNATERGIVVRTLDYDDRSVIAVDFGAAAGDVAVDIVDDTVIVVADDQQFEFVRPPEAADVSVKNGVLTISE
ncbi:hypothetical protein Halru_2838 [Halovivax ruber XH-70]|uniref:Uncharacterized protein n=1 Tax=Halovivax ruber (strain DSM 18193 / JCM 13892 / XH-70) TaxID=797302 RepID=L0IF76_HALRX|nr:hypothetical protein [Halovivax ruber]AGB17409.1 hypothetical protein Halru_2838 [Halovivax ruber XH-70]